MINKKKTGLCLALAATLIASSALCGCQQSDSSTSAKFNSDVKDASKYTADENAQVYKTLDFSDEQEKEFAKKGFITAPDKLEIKTENGTVAWSQTAYDFIRNSSTPDSANPSLWRNTELNSLYGLFEVVDGVYQVRGYEKAVMEENVFAGNAMKRRTNFQYGSLLEKGEKGSLSVGIGLTPSSGTTTYISPSYEVKKATETIKVDGVEMVFQLTPNTESPAEMNTYLPKYKALWMAENCSGTMHNLYTLRGAEVRDGNAWAQYIMEAKELFGDKTEVVFQAHNWPHWGNDVINDYMANTASVYKYIFSQTLMYINQGYTSTEIANMMELPDELNKIWYTRQYYGTLKHNVKAVYQKYMGWYDENPIHLDELEPTEYSKKLVEYLGDTDKVLEMAKKDFDKGEYQWVAQITNTLVYADPENKDARYLCADALEQLGYQAESGAWRNAYLTGAYELRNGTKNYPNSEGSGATALGMSTETMLDYLGICLDEKKLEDQNLVINLEVTDKNAKYLLRINHGVLIYSQEKWSDKADATIKTKSAGILGIAQNNQKLMDAGIEKVEGNSDIIKTLTSSVAEFPLYFNIIEP